VASFSLLPLGDEGSISMVGKIARLQWENLAKGQNMCSPSLWAPFLGPNQCWMGYYYFLIITKSVILFEYFWDYIGYQCQKRVSSRLSKNQQITNWL
jgi:hypothetical protein